MEGVPFDWNDYLSSEGLSDIALAAPGMQGGQMGQAGNHPPPHMIQPSETAAWPSIPKHVPWYNQLLAAEPNFQNASVIPGYNVYGNPSLDLSVAPPQVALNNDTVTTQRQDQHSGSVRAFEIPEDGLNLTSPQQVPGSAIPQTDTARDPSTHDNHVLKALIPDQICACPACLRNYFFFDKANVSALDTHPDRKSWVFSCRVAGCQWTTEDIAGAWNSELRKLVSHEVHHDHYGKPGDYRCREDGCKFLTKRRTDLIRHYSSKHCIKPQKFECPDLGCKYHQTGFTRKDKLQSHYQHVHEGKLRPGKPNQAIKPKVNHGA